MLLPRKLSSDVINTIQISVIAGCEPAQFLHILMTNNFENNHSDEDVVEVDKAGDNTEDYHESETLRGSRILQLRSEYLRIVRK